MPSLKLICSVCDRPSLANIPMYTKLQRISSDGKLLRPGGRLYQCEQCNAVQKYADAEWFTESLSIYENYSSYSESDGIEQSVLGGSSTGNQFYSRSHLLIKNMFAQGLLPTTGRLLDYGCGRSPTSRAAQEILSGWKVDGYDLDQRCKLELEALNNFDKLFSGPSKNTINQIIDSGQRYDLIALVHVLEHIPHAKATLSSLAKLLTPNGRLLIQVPNREENPFDLLVADHSIHCDPSSLYEVVQRSGFFIEILSKNWIRKELTLITQPNSKQIIKPTQGKISAANQVEWLLQLRRVLQDVVYTRPWGIFGTSNIAKWIKQEIGLQPDFYIDEDPAKQATRKDGIEILMPEKVPVGSKIIMAMTPLLAQRVMKRLAPLKLQFFSFPSKIT